MCDKGNNTTNNYKDVITESAADKQRSGCHSRSVENRGKDTHLDEDEFLNCVKVPLKEVVDQVMRGAIIDGKTIAMTLKLQAMLEEEQ